VSASLTKPRLELLVAIESESWGAEEPLQDLASHVLETAAAWLKEKEKQKFGRSPVEVSLLFTDDAAIQAINAEWRGMDKPTNVLSFPAYPITPGEKPGPMLGDIILARETLEREAGEMGKPFQEHLTHLLVHGFLHLFGYDHIEDHDAEKMEGLESSILAHLGLSDPYAEADT
jgi:probable rRNA maturation factor